MTDILLIPNMDKENSVQCVNAVIAETARLGLTSLLDVRYADCIKENGCVFGEPDRLLERCDLLLPIGGDGTILHAVSHAVKADKPILGINTGTVGFLTQLELSEVHALSRIKDGDYTIENRMLLEVITCHQTMKEIRRLVLNDIVLQSKSGKLVNLSVNQNNKVIAVQRANGLIFATPTGSTAYSLAAGGSIADPALEVVLLTAICPYSAYNRSFILPSDGEYTVGTPDGECLTLSFDGNDVGELLEEQTILVRKSNRYAKLIHLGLHDFYSNLYDKLSLRR